MKIVDSGFMSSIDRRSEAEFAYPLMILMENAGIKSMAALKKHIWKGRVPNGPLVFVAGKGNNGGDALVMARQCFSDGIGGVVIILSDVV